MAIQPNFISRRLLFLYTIDGGPAQMSYVGGISLAERHFDSYEDRLAHAIIQDGITLTEESIPQPCPAHDGNPGRH